MTDAGTENEGPELHVLASLRRRVLRGSSWVMFARIASILLGTSINAMLARLMTKDEVGVYFTSFTLVIVGTVIAQLGLDRAVVRLVAVSLGVGLPGRARETIRRCLSIGTVAAVGVGAVLTFALGPTIVHHLYHSRALAYVVPITGGWLVAAAIQSLFVETLRGLQRFDKATIFDALIVDVLTATVLGALFALGVRIGVGTAAGISAGMTMVAVIGGGMALRTRYRDIHGEGHLERGAILDMAWPSLITNVAIYLLGSGVDLLVLAAFRPQDQVALYGSATRLVTLVATPLWILRGVMPPIIAELHAQGRRRELEHTLRAGATLASLPSLALLIVFMLFGRGIMSTVYRPTYADGATVLAILSFGRLFAVWSGACGITLIMTGHQKEMMYITVCTGLTSVGLGILAAHQFGGVGVATATMSMALVQNALQLLLVKRYVGVWTFAELSPRALFRFFSKKGIAELAEQLSKAEGPRKRSDAELAAEVQADGDQVFRSSPDEADL